MMNKKQKEEERKRLENLYIHGMIAGSILILLGVGMFLNQEGLLFLGVGLSMTYVLINPINRLLKNIQR